MKALSLRPHWAHAVIHLGKDIETRSWSTSYRGPLFIHAGKALTRNEFERIGEIALEDRLPVPERADIRDGGIIGKVSLVDIVTRSRSKWFGGEFGWVLADPVPLPFFALKGQLKLFNVDLKSA